VTKKCINQTKKRTFRWAVRWFRSDGKRYSKSFKTRKEAERYSKKIQASIDKGKPDKPKKITLRAFKSEHEMIMKDRVADKTRKDHIRAFLNAGRAGLNYSDR